MSRLILKNLPKNIKEENLKQLFGSKGEITDFKLCYSKSGTFRRFGFIGFKTEKEAQSALKHFNNTYINTSKIQIQTAKNLGDGTVPRPWSKYSELSSTFIRKQKENEERKLRIQKLQDKSNNGMECLDKKSKREYEKLKSKNKKQKAIEFLKSIHEVENDSGFKDFLEAHQKRSIKQTWTNEASAPDLNIDGKKKTDNQIKSLKKNENCIAEMKNKSKDGLGVTYEDQSEESDSEYQDVKQESEDEELDSTDPKDTADKVGEKTSDLVWLKSKSNKVVEKDKMENSDKDILKQKNTLDTSLAEDSESDSDSSGSQSDSNSSSSNSNENEMSLTIKMRGIPFKSQEKDIINFFSPLKIRDIRIPLNENDKPTGNAYVDLTSESDVKEALKRNKCLMKKRYVELFREKKGNLPENSKEIEFKSKQGTAAEEEEEPVAESGRLFLRNLSYSCSEDEIQKYFEIYGPLAEVNLPIDKSTKKSMGFGFVTYLMPEHAVKAFNELDGRVFQGRLLHILPARMKKSIAESHDGDKSHFKKTKEDKQKALSSSSHNWNSLFLGLNAVADVMAERMNSSKNEILDAVKSNSLAVRMALGETEIVAETREFLVSSGVKLDVFGQPAAKRSTTVILVKNLPHGTQPRELKETFGKYGGLGRVLLPPAGITAIIEFLQPSEAREAFRNLAYSKFKHVPLFLEWAPVDVFSGPQLDLKKQGIDKEKDQEKLEDSDDEKESEEGYVLFVKNLNFDTTEDSMKELFSSIGKVKSATIARKKDPKKPGSLLSLGYGFVEFKKKESTDKALKSLQHTQLDGHQLELKKSHRKTMKSTSARKKATSTKQKTSKILVRNVPFEATKRELQELFGAFGEIKTLRIPKKMAGTGTHRGFAFVDFLTKQDAKRAFKALCQSTHLYGRRLVLEWAEEEETIEMIRQRTAQHFHEGPPAKKSKQNMIDKLEMSKDEES